MSVKSASDTDRQVGLRIRAARQLRRLSQAELADRLGVSAGQLADTRAQ